MLDPADEIEKKLRGKRCRAAGEIIIGGHLDQIDTDDITPLCQAIQKFKDFIIEEPPMRGGAGAAGDRGSKPSMSMVT